MGKEKQVAFGDLTMQQPSSNDRSNINRAAAMD
jgi:hypothetical protein